MKKLEIKNLKNGFTIIEMLISMALLSILLVILSSIFTAVIDMRLESEASNSVAQDGQYFLTRLMYDIPRAQSITTPATAGDAASSLVLSISGATFTYTLQNGNIFLNDGSGAIQINGLDTSISGLTFTRIGNANGKDTIKIAYTITSRIQKASGEETKSYSTTIGLR